MTLLQTQDINPLTGDVGLNPAAWGLSMKDINSAASVSLKSSIYAGNVNLTADQYREVETLVLDKYSAIDSTGIIAPGGITKNGDLAPAIDMTGKDSGLYMSNDKLGFYDGTDWRVWIGNTGDFLFRGDIDNYISWNGSLLSIKGDVEVADGSITAPKLSTSLLYTGSIELSSGGNIRSGKATYSDSLTGFWLGNDGGVPKFKIGTSTEYMSWNGSAFSIIGGTITGSLFKSSFGNERIEIQPASLRGYDSTGSLRTLLSAGLLGFYSSDSNVAGFISAENSSGGGGVLFQSTSNIFKFNGGLEILGSSGQYYAESSEPKWKLGSEILSIPYRNNGPIVLVGATANRGIPMMIDGALYYLQAVAG